MNKQDRRAIYRATHDIYGNNAERQAEIEAMERHLDAALAIKLAALAAARAARATRIEWWRPMGIDEAIHPITKKIYDYGRDPDWRTDEPTKLMRELDNK